MFEKKEDFATTVRKVCYACGLSAVTIKGGMGIFDANDPMRGGEAVFLTDKPADEDLVAFIEGVCRTVAKRSRLWQYIRKQE